MEARGITCGDLLIRTELHRELKLYAVQHDRTIRGIVIKTIKETIGGKSRTKSKKR